MVKGWVSNASPLILFKRISRLDLLRELCQPLLVPQGVLKELKAYPGESKSWNDFSKTVELVRIPRISSIIQGWDLGRGEAEVITWAYQHPGHEAILDDQAARKCARSLEIPLRGSVGLMLLAKRRGLVPAAKPLIDELIKQGMWFEKKWVARALELVEE